jgi:hypothetical protein
VASVLTEIPEVRCSWAPWAAINYFDWRSLIWSVTSQGQTLSRTCHQRSALGQRYFTFPNTGPTRPGTRRASGITVAVLLPTPPTGPNTAELVCFFLETL